MLRADMSCGLLADSVRWAGILYLGRAAAQAPPPSPSSSLKLRSCCAAETAKRSNLAI